MDLTGLKAGGLVRLTIWVVFGLIVGFGANPMRPWVPVVNKRRRADWRWFSNGTECIHLLRTTQCFVIILCRNISKEFLTELCGITMQVVMAYCFVNKFEQRAVRFQYFIVLTGFMPIS